MSKRLGIYLLIALCAYAGRADETLKAEIASASVRVGDVFDVAITLSDTATADSIDWRITYDPAVLTATAVKSGPASLGWQFWGNPYQTGLVQIAEFTVYGSSGGGVMAFVTFTAIAPGITPLVLTCSINEGWIPVTVTNGAVASTARIELPPRPHVPRISSRLGSDL